MNVIAKYIHGSGDSLDTDVYYVVDQVPEHHVAKQFCDAIKDENANLISIKDGVVDAVYKGTPDECNNSLLATYDLHHQTYPLLITRGLTRKTGLKCIRCIRIILSHISRSQYREAVKEALRSDSFYKKLNTLISIDLSTIDFSQLAHNNMSKQDVLKVIAFQTAQTLALMSGVEVYTKAEASLVAPELRPFIYREECDLDVLSKYVTRLCECMVATIHSEQDGTVTLYGETYNVINETLV